MKDQGLMADGVTEVMLLGQNVNSMERHWNIRLLLHSFWKQVETIED